MDSWLKSLCDSLVQEEADELLVNGCRSASLVKGNSYSKISVPFGNDMEFDRALQDFVFGIGKRLDPNAPFAGGVLYPLGIRWHAVLSSISPDGSLLSLRRHRFSKIKLDNFGLSSKQRDVLCESILLKKPIIIIGPTGSGKTTFLNALLRDFLLRERLVFLESITEMELQSPSWLRLCEKQLNIHGTGQVTMEELISQSLRLRPDRIVIGEIRGREIIGLQQAAFCGHPGVLTTLHAASIDEAYVRLDMLSDFYLGSKFCWKGLVSDACFVLMERENPSCVKDIYFSRREA